MPGTAPHKDWSESNRLELARKQRSGPGTEKRGEWHARVSAMGIVGARKPLRRNDAKSLRHAKRSGMDREKARPAER